MVSDLHRKELRELATSPQTELLGGKTRPFNNLTKLNSNPHAGWKRVFDAVASSATMGCSHAPSMLRILLRASNRSCSFSPRISSSRGRLLSTSIGIPDTESAEQHTLQVNGAGYRTDAWTNVPPSIVSAVGRRLHLQRDHPLAMTRKLIESQFPETLYKRYNDFSPVVSTDQNFDSLGFGPDHPGRSRKDTYYINKDTLLRTHTSAHQVEAFRATERSGFLICADVYRRDAVDKSHYPVFHQMEGGRSWDRTRSSSTALLAEVEQDILDLPRPTTRPIVEDEVLSIATEANPLQPGHTKPEVEAISVHLKRSLENLMIAIFDQAKLAAAGQTKNSDSSSFTDSPLNMRWVPAFFPFTTPSWELEVFWEGDWLEVLGCGIVKQDVYRRAGMPEKIGWAFGIGIERIAMLLFAIPDIRLFWSQDERFLTQFSEERDVTRFVPFSRHPASPKDVSFWLRSSSSSAGGGTRANAQDFSENDVHEIVRNVAGDAVEKCEMTDDFTHPSSGRRSLCFRVTYRSLHKTLTKDEANSYHELVRTALAEKLGVELR